MVLGICPFLRLTNSIDVLGRSKLDTITPLQAARECSTIRFEEFPLYFCVTGLGYG